MFLTDDPDEARRIQAGEPDEGQHSVYLVLSDEERAKGFVRPLRRSYVHRFMHDGSPVPTVLTSMEGVGGCGALTSMAVEIAETYARDPGFYGRTFCVHCNTHLPVGEFVWDGTSEKVGS